MLLKAVHSNRKFFTDRVAQNVNQHQIIKNRIKRIKVCQ